MKAFGNKKSINATTVRPSTDPHEIYFHMMETIVTSLGLQNGMVRTRDACGDLSSIEFFFFSLTNNQLFTAEPLPRSDRQRQPILVILPEGQTMTWQITRVYLFCSAKSSNSFWHSQSAMKVAFMLGWLRNLYRDFRRIQTMSGMDLSLQACIIRTNTKNLFASDALDALMDAGHIYTTSDDSHFQVSR